MEVDSALKVGYRMPHRPQVKVSGAVARYCVIPMVSWCGGVCLEFYVRLHTMLNSEVGRMS